MLLFLYEARISRNNILKLYLVRKRMYRTLGIFYFKRYKLHFVHKVIQSFEAGNGRYKRIMIGERDHDRVMKVDIYWKTWSSISMFS